MITAHLVTCLAAILQVGVSPATVPQHPAAPVDSGSRIRITVNKPSKHFFIGTLVSADADSLRFADSSGVSAIPIASVDRLERSRGRRSNAGRGALIGGLIGAGAGLVLGLAASAEEGGWYEVGAEDVAVATVFLGAIAGSVGALIGAASKGERWEPVILRDAVPTLR